MKRGAGEERKESNRLNLAIFLVCAFLVTLSIEFVSLNKLYKFGQQNKYSCLFSRIFHYPCFVEVY